ncbi:VanZ family protein [Actinotalea ferrariae]|uniref:VanZ family protein n=1 Tax=Actinotalea ferrariae TaxID=1386098 RepID=UPI001C8B3F91|nr:VanZ family protein [Actinotalea ferrariae]MBX9244134.1 VanZ family protein [Actinotalea ferrariae]
MSSLRTPAARRVATAAFAVYLVALAAAAFLPLRGTGSGAGSGGEIGINLVLSRPDLLGSWEAERNVLMTIPLGLLLPLVVRRRYELLVLTCAAVPLVIETGQLLGSLALGRAWRAFDVNDLLLNTVGGLIGLGVTGAVLALLERPERPPLRRLVPGALAAGLVVWAVGSTLTTPSDDPVVWACDARPSGAVTSLPGGAEVYAGIDGGLCVRTPDGGSSSLPPDVEAGPVTRYEADGTTFEVRVADVVGRSRAGDGPRSVHTVEGSDLVMWEVTTG